MKKLVLAGAALALLSGAANAADLPRSAPQAFSAVPVFTWTGVYIGSDTAYAFSDRERITTVGNLPGNVANVAAGRRPASVSNRQDGTAYIGGTFGYNYQFTPGSGFVVGGAVSVEYLDLHKNTFVLGAPLAGGVLPNPNAFYQGLGYLGTLNGRVGYAWDRFLVYGTGGLAFGHVAYASSFYTPAGVLQFDGERGGFETGYNYGGGVEYAIPLDSLIGKFDLLEFLGVKIGGTSTVKAEYIRYDLGSRSVPVAAIPGVGTGSYTSRFHTEGSLVRVGFNYKFGPGGM